VSGQSSEVTDVVGHDNVGVSLSGDLGDVRIVDAPSHDAFLRRRRQERSMSAASRSVCARSKTAARRSIS